MTIELNIESINFGLQNLNLPIIILIGPPGAGKTVVGMQLAKDLNWDFYDTDLLIEKASSLTVAEIFYKYKEVTFRQLEKSLLSQITKLCQNSFANTQSLGGTILSTGGGLPVPAENFISLEKIGKIVCLTAPPSILIERIVQIKHRPLLNSNNIESKNTESTKSEQLSKLKKLLAERQEVYAKTPLQIDTSNSSVEEVVTRIRSLLKL